MIEAYDKTIKVIESCTKTMHFSATKEMIINFWFMFRDVYYYEKLYRAYNSKMDQIYYGKM